MTFERRFSLNFFCPLEAGLVFEANSLVALCLSELCLRILLVS